MLDRTRSRLADAGYAAGWGLVKSMPPTLARRGFSAAAGAAAMRNGAGTRQLRANYRRLAPTATEHELDGLVAAGLRSYARYWLETFRLPRMDRRDVAERIEANTTGSQNLTAALERGRGVVLALPHSGNWDVAGVWLVERHGRFATVAERLRPESLYDRFVAYRESLGFEILPLTGGARPPLEVLRERLAANGLVCLMADRDLSRRGVEVEFFGERTRMPGGPAVLAATTGAALLPVGLHFTDEGRDGGWGQVIHPPIEPVGVRLRDQVTALTQQVATTFEADIAAHPADWHMLQRLWLADLPPRAQAERAVVPDAAGGG